MVGMATFGKGFSEHSQLRELIGLKPTWTKKEAIKRGFPEYQRLGNHRADDQATKELSCMVVPVSKLTKQGFYWSARCRSILSGHT